MSNSSLLENARARADNQEIFFKSKKPHLKAGHRVKQFVRIPV